MIDKQTFILILHFASLSFEGLTEHEIKKRWDVSPKVIQRGIQLSDDLKREHMSLRELVKTMNLEKKYFKPQTKKASTKRKKTKEDEFQGIDDNTPTPKINHKSNSLKKLIEKMKRENKKPITKENNSRTGEAVIHKL